MDNNNTREKLLKEVANEWMCDRLRCDARELGVPVKEYAEWVATYLGLAREGLLPDEACKRMRKMFESMARSETETALEVDEDYWRDLFEGIGFEPSKKRHLS